MPKISCIVPIYKVEPYLHRCVDSILAQTFTDFEVILVDDGSPDNCGVICDEYATKDNRIHVIHKENGGLSSARNAGIDWAFANSDSEYLAFIDSDDWVSEFYLEKLYNAMIETNSDLVACNYVYEFNGNEYECNDFYRSKTKFKDRTITKSEALMLLQWNYPYNFSWNKLYKKKIFTYLRFKVGKLHEDDFIIHYVIDCCETITTISEALYYYSIRENSIMTTEKFSGRLDAFESLVDRLEFYDKNGYSITTFYRYFYFENQQNYFKFKEKELKNRFKALKERYIRIVCKYGSKKMFIKTMLPSKVILFFRMIKGIVKRSLFFKVLKRVRLYLVVAKGFIVSFFEKKPTNDDNFKIDIVLTYLNSSDANWLNDKNKYLTDKQDINCHSSRYRDWDILRYWFRCIETNAPWVNKIHLITYAKDNHLPNWLNISCEKLNIVKHEDIIPKNYLPTFSSHTIEWAMCDIKDLSEHFIYLNDDVFITKPCVGTNFFHKNLPLYSPMLEPIEPFDGAYYHARFNSSVLINRSFNLRNTIRKNPHLWFNRIYSKKQRKKNKKAFFENRFLGMHAWHLSLPIIKSRMKAFKDIYSNEVSSSMSKFRNNADIMHQAFEMFEIMKGNFYPMNPLVMGKIYSISNNSIQEIERDIKKKRYPVLCLNDNEQLSVYNFDILKKKIHEIFESVYPNKSNFELD